MLSHLLLVLPVVIPLAAAVILLLFRKKPEVQQWINLGSMVGLLGVSLRLLAEVSAHGIQVTGLASWPLPFAITFVGDHLSIIMLVTSAIMGLAVAIYSMGEMDADRIKFGFYPFINLLLAGIAGAFLTGDLFNLYVWFEVLLIASFALMSLGNTREQLSANIKYVGINLVSSLLFLGGIGMVYGLTGTLNMAEIASVLQGTDQPGLVTAVSMMFLIAFGIKAAVFPLYFWLPASYHTPPPSVMALFAGLLSKVGVYALIRVYTLIFTHDIPYIQTLLIWIAGFTMVSGVLGAAVQKDFRRILSFHIISQIGYMIMGLALLTPLALVGAIYYIVHNIFAKSNLFLISGIADKLSGTFSLKKLGGLYAGFPALSTLFLLSAFALAGFPPLSGFWGKLLLGIAAVQTQDYIILGVAFAVGLMTMFSMTKIWMNAFLPKEESGYEPIGYETPSIRRSVQIMMVPVILVAICILGISLFIGPVYEFGSQAATELMNADMYINAVLN